MDREYELLPESLEAQRKEPFWLGFLAGMVVCLILWIFLS